MEYTKENVSAWLLNYAWLDNEESQKREVDCIMAQDDWRYLAARVDRTQGKAVDHFQATDAEGYELSALYECHDEPHLPTCPRA